MQPGKLDRLEDAISKLDNMPEKFRRYEREPWRSRGLRVFPVDNYLVFYIPDMERQIVTVIRVMYGGRDVDKELRDAEMLYRVRDAIDWDLATIYDKQARLSK